MFFPLQLNIYENINNIAKHLLIMLKALKSRKKNYLFSNIHIFVCVIGKRRKRVSVDHKRKKNINSIGLCLRNIAFIKTFLGF